MPAISTGGMPATEATVSTFITLFCAMLMKPSVASSRNCTLSSRCSSIVLQRGDILSQRIQPGLQFRRQPFLGVAEHVGHDAVGAELAIADVGDHLAGPADAASVSRSSVSSPLRAQPLATRGRSAAKWRPDRRASVRAHRPGDRRCLEQADQDVRATTFGGLGQNWRSTKASNNRLVAKRIVSSRSRDSTKPAETERGPASSRLTSGMVR